MNLSNYFETHYCRKLVGKSERTRVQYRVTIRLFSRWLGREAVLADINDCSIPDWFAALLESGSSHPTINKHRRQLLAIARYAAHPKRRHLAEVPEIEKLKEIDTDPVCWTLEEIGQILHECSTLKGRFGKKPKGEDTRIRKADFWVALIETLFCTGARIGVIMRLPSECYDRSERMLLLPARLQKQGKDQWVPLSAEAVAAIEKIYRPEAPYLFNFPFDRKTDPSFSTLHSHFREILEEAGLDNKHGTFHRIRRTRATYGEIASPGSATRDLGHSDPRVTRRYISQKVMKPSRTIDLIPRPQMPPQA